MRTDTKFLTTAAGCVGLMLIGLPADTLAVERLDVGRLEYDTACAVCHGRSGKGDDGPLKPFLALPAPNLTVLAKNNNGVFPFDRVYKIIDGREEIKAHGPRGMPVWGRAFSGQSSLYFENFPSHDTESVARSRILAVTEYLYRLQE